MAREHLGPGRLAHSQAQVLVMGLPEASQVNATPRATNHGTSVASGEDVLPAVGLDELPDAEDDLEGPLVLHAPLPGHLQHGGGAAVGSGSLYANLPLSIEFLVIMV